MGERMESGTENDDDAITRAFLSGSAYERLRLQRETYFSQPLPKKLTWQIALLGGVVLLLPLYSMFPATVAEYVPSVDPALASPKVLLLGLVGTGVELFTALLLIGAALYRIRRYPLTKKQAMTVLNVEDFASYLGFVAGGAAIGLTVVYFVLGLAGGQAIESYVTSMDGVNPFAASGVGLSVVELAVFAFTGCIVLTMVRLYLQLQFVRLDVA